jgi:hypothetical protein
MSGIFAATSTYGRGFKPTKVPDQYSIRIYVGGFAGSGTADNSVKKEIDVFLNNEGYASYETISRRFNAIPTYYEYIVQFKHSQEPHPA